MLTPVRKNTANYFDKGHIQLKIHNVLNQSISHLKPYNNYHES